ncbi:MAG TPA: sugar porter family MFS transporter [Mycobacteriales bacterium]|nr:sugar porter family MFS transporter [Mycobacteriales bacterium]
MAGFAREAFSGRNRMVSGIAAIAALGGLLFGYDTGVISGAVLYIDKDLHGGKSAEQWYVGALLLGAVLGAIASGWLARRISRKWTKVASGCVYVGAALWSALAQSPGELIAARATLGLSVGTASFVSPLYISEHTPPKLRGGTVSFNQLMITSGILLAYIVDWAFKGVTNNWRWMLGLGAVPGIALAVGMFFMPHTPRWLVQAGRDDEATQVLKRTRSGDVESERNEIHDVIDQERSAGLRELFGRALRPMIVVGLALAIFQQLVGVNTVIYYSPTILKATGLTADQSVTQALSVGITNVVFTVVAILLLDRVGRRKLLVTGTVGLTIALAVLGAYFQVPTLRQSYSWVALAALLLFIASFAIGLGPVFWLMISEIFPLRGRTMAMALCTVANWGSNFLVSFYFLSLVGWVGRPGTFWIYGGFGVAAMLFFLLRIPETKGRSLEDIERDIGAYPEEGSRPTRREARDRARASQP